MHLYIMGLILDRYFKKCNPSPSKHYLNNGCPPHRMSTIFSFVRSIMWLQAGSSLPNWIFASHFGRLLYGSARTQSFETRRGRRKVKARSKHLKDASEKQTCSILKTCLKLAQDTLMMPRVGLEAFRRPHTP